MVIKTVEHFVDSSMGVEISSKKEELTEKEGEGGGGCLAVVLPGRGANDILSRRKGLPGRPGVGGNYTD